MTVDKPVVVQEYVDSRDQSLSSDSGAGVLRGVKLLGYQSRNGRRYEERALREAVGLYEGAKVNVNHPKGDPLSVRDYQDRLGVIRNVRLVSENGLFGDLHYNPKHTLSEQLLWDAENAPENVGLSHNVLARTRRDRNEIVVEAITKVQSVDLVSDPATTQGLYEHAPGVVEELTAPSEPSEEFPAVESNVWSDELELLQEKLARVEHCSRITQKILGRAGGFTLNRDTDRLGVPISESFLADLMQTTDDVEVDRMIDQRIRELREVAGRSSKASEVEAREGSLIGEEVNKSIGVRKSEFLKAVKSA